MPAAKSKAAPASNGAAPRGKASSNSGTSTPVSTTDKKDTSDASATFSTGKPDKKAYDVEQETIKKEIDALQVKLSAVRDKITLATKSGSGNDRRAALRAELDKIRDQQSSRKTSRAKILDQVKASQESIQKKIKDLQAAKAKVPFKTVAEVDAHIKNLEKQVESGSMKLADEKRALQEISTSKRNRRIVEGFRAEQDAIEAERANVEELRKQLDDPEFKAISDRYDTIKDELDQLKKEGDEAYAGRAKLFEERDNIQNQLTTLYNQKRESAQQFREANDRYWQKVNEDRARRAERARAQRAAEEAQKKQEIAQRLREEAEIPAFQAQIEDCQTLIDFLSGKTTGNVTYKSTPLAAKAEVAGVPKLEIRKVEGAPEGSIVRKKKGEEEEAYFVGGKGKGKGKRGTAKASDANGTEPTSPSTATGPLNLPLPTLSALMSLSIPPPASAADVPRVIEDLKTKKAWFEANQARVTAENIAKAESEIQRLTNAAKDTKSTDVTPNVPGEYPREPTPTPQDGTVPPGEAATTATLEKVEAVLEEKAEAGAEQS
ncbi:putative nuclear segregation protein Bfr1 [Lyophyllum shimeji]|uniref:Nuclear segregation protein Bfr1 n=1 Tax=Lyophyllum shimeji TaxID=47721 RepID=A0A9P3PDE8_LYOSH|nr:putative nuclear segregation protein Bfr1 [Lyophyllum shimeji]